MSEYLEFFRVEAKSLLKNFRDNDENAIARCAKVFGERTDLSLMNMQHVVAKEFVLPIGMSYKALNVGSWRRL